MTREDIIAMAREVSCESDLTPAILCTLFQYDNGVLRWAAKLNKRIVLNSVAGSKEGNGYIQIMINGKRYKAHRLTYLMFHGSLPCVIDHVNGIRNDNKIENLRAATLCENARNARTPYRNTTGAKNVYWHKRKNKWSVSISVNDKAIHFGYYDDFVVAKNAAAEARIKFHKEFANHD